MKIQSSRASFVVYCIHVYSYLKSVEEFISLWFYHVKNVTEMEPTFYYDLFCTLCIALRIFFALFVNKQSTIIDTLNETPKTLILQSILKAIITYIHKKAVNKVDTYCHQVSAMKYIPTFLFMLGLCYPINNVCGYR